MRHVDEGDLHAYLDGGLEEYAGNDAERIRAHLDRCDACRARLEEERAVRARATAVLDGADPGSVDAPPFEEIRRRARAGGGAGEAGRGRGLSRTDVLRIAATAVVALGVGWMGGRALPGGPPGGSTPEAATDRAERPPSISMPAPPEEAGDVAPAAGGAARAVAGTDAGAAAAASTTGTEEVQVAEAEAAEEAEEASEVVAAPTPEPPAAEERSRDFVRELDSAGLVLDEVVVTGQAAPLDSLAADRRELRAAGAASQDPAAVEPGDADAVAAARAAPVPAPQFRAESFAQVETEARPPGRGLAVPGLDVVSVRWTEVAPGVRGLRMIQRLSGGPTIELRYGGFLDEAGIPGALLDEVLPEGMRQVARPFGDGWVVARARLAEADIRGLLDRLR